MLDDVIFLLLEFFFALAHLLALTSCASNCSLPLCGPAQCVCLVCCAIYPYLPVRPLLVKHTVSTVPAADRLAALERDVHVAVAALVVHGARGCVDGAGGSGIRGGLLGVVCRGHFEVLV